jgi:hypothetical protein
MNDPRDILCALERQTQDGGELAALDHHLRALMLARAGDLAGAGAALTAAQAWESSNSCARAALHTAHELALITNFAGDLERLGRYYRETIRTLKRMRNREGMALCLRSIGELALLSGNDAEMAKAWELSERLFAALNLGESRQLSAWIALSAMFQLPNSLRPLE